MSIDNQSIAIFEGVHLASTIFIFSFFDIQAPKSS